MFVVFSISDFGKVGAMNYLLSVEYATEPTDKMYDIDADLSAIALGGPDASGYGCGYRDHEWACSTKEEAESLAKEMGEFLTSEKIEHTIEIEAEDQEN